MSHDCLRIHYVLKYCYSSIINFHLINFKFTFALARNPGQFVILVRALHMIRTFYDVPAYHNGCQC